MDHVVSLVLLLTQLLPKRKTGMIGSGEWFEGDVGGGYPKKSYPPKTGEQLFVFLFLWGRFPPGVVV